MQLDDTELKALALMRTEHGTPALLRALVLCLEVRQASAHAVGDRISAARYTRDAAEVRALLRKFRGGAHVA